MNIFVLQKDPRTAAVEHCDQHVRKMIIEYAQMLSTAHRLLDGKMVPVRVNKRSKRLYLLPGELASVIETEVETPEGATSTEVVKIVGGRGHYLVAHPNHPCTVWCRTSTENYGWLYQLFASVCNEYTYRFGKLHATEEKLLNVLRRAPNNLAESPLTPFPQAMPEQFKVKDDAVAAYRNFYLGEKIRFSTWTGRELPSWFKAGLDQRFSPAYFVRPRALDRAAPAGS
jgi:hypothetical protein